MTFLEEGIEAAEEVEEDHIAHIFHQSGKSRLSLTLMFPSEGWLKVGERYYWEGASGSCQRLTTVLGEGVLLHEDFQQESR